MLDVSVFDPCHPWPNCLAASRTASTVWSMSAFVVRKFVMQARRANLPWTVAFDK